MSGIITKYRVFREQLMGFADVPISDFRTKLLPLCKKREWTAAEREYVGELAERGCGYALQRLFGRGQSAPMSAEVLGRAVIPEAPVTKEILDAILRDFLSSTALAGWTTDDYETYLGYLNSNMTPDGLKERLAEMQRMTHTGSPDATSADAGKETTGAVDAFAEMYRNAPGYFQRIIDRSIRSS